MHLYGIHHSVPPSSYTQTECWDVLQQSPSVNNLTERSRSILRKVLCGDSGIDKRHFAITDFEKLFTLDAEGLHHAFAAAAPELATAAARKALDKAKLKPTDCDALFVCTCTGYLCPGLSSYVAEQLDLSPHAYLQDLVGLGCGAAIPTLRSAANFLAANPGSTVCVIAVEVCSAAFYLDNDPGVLISLCLFGDGAVAAILGDRPGHPTNLGTFSDFDTIHLPADREFLRFGNCKGKLRNQLHKCVPDKAAPAVRALYDRTTHPANSTIICHTGGRDVLAAINNTFPDQPLTASTRTLADFGNMSSPSVLAALDRQLNSDPTPQPLWLTSFGAGFSAHSCRFISNTR